MQISDEKNNFSVLIILLSSPEKKGNKYQQQIQNVWRPNAWLVFCAWRDVDCKKTIIGNTFGKKTSFKPSRKPQRRNHYQAVRKGVYIEAAQH